MPWSVKVPAGEALWIGVSFRMGLLVFLLSSRSLKSFMSFLLAVGLALPGGMAWSSNSSSARAPLNEPQGQFRDLELFQSPLSTLYRVRVLLEEPSLWPVAHDLLQNLLRNYRRDLPSEVRRKLRKAAELLSHQVRPEWYKELTNARALMRPFLESQYLVNEAIMDLRSPLNSASDYELHLVENLLKTYFFPGFEDYGRIHYPDMGSYAFDLYALTDKNIAAARLEPARQPPPQPARPSPAPRTTTPTSPINRPITGPGTSPPTAPNSPRTPPTIRLPGLGVPSPSSAEPSSDSAIASTDEPAPLRSPVVERLAIELAEQEERDPEDVKGFLQDLIDAGVTLDNIVVTAKTIWDSVDKNDRVYNRYLPESLLLQAVAEPASALIDPQIQDFLQGVRLEIKLADIDDASLTKELENWSALMGEMGVEYKDIDKPNEGDFVIDLKSFAEREHQDPFSEWQLLIRRPRGAARATINIVTGVGGADLSRLQFLMYSVRLIQDKTLIHQKVISKIPLLPQSGAAARQYLRLMQHLPQLSSKALAHAQTSRNAVMATVFYTKYGAVKGFETVNKLWPLLGAVKDSRPLQWALAQLERPAIQGGGLLKALVAVSFISHVTVGSIEAHYEQDPDRRALIQMEAASRSMATLMYLIPIAGVAFATVDAAHWLFGFPIETASIFRQVFWGFEEVVSYYYNGVSSDMAYLQRLEARFGLPVHPVMYRQFLNRNEDLESTDKQMGRLYAQHQDTAHRMLVLIYVAHHTDFRNSNRLSIGSRYSFGKRVLEYYEGFEENKDEFVRVRNRLRNMRASFIADSLIRDFLEDDERGEDLQDDFN